MRVGHTDTSRFTFRFIGDAELHECAKYRVKCRLPALCWRSGSAVICRSSQPRVGLLGMYNTLCPAGVTSSNTFLSVASFFNTTHQGFARSSADEKFINALGAINPSVPVRIIDVRYNLATARACVPWCPSL